MALSAFVKCARALRLLLVRRKRCPEASEDQQSVAQRVHDDRKLGNVVPSYMVLTREMALHPIHCQLNLAGQVKRLSRLDPKRMACFDGLHLFLAPHHGSKDRPSVSSWRAFHDRFIRLRL